jgi:hypothetical protein
MSTRHTFAAALVLLALTASLLPLVLAQDQQQKPADKANRSSAADTKATEAADSSCSRIPADADERERKIYEALSKPTDIDFEEKPLKDVVEKLAQTSGIQIQFDEKALSEAAVATDTPVTKHLRGISLRSTLRILLRPLQLTYDIRNGVLLITSQTEAENHQIVRIYPVRDLVSDEHGNLDFDPLIDLIQRIVEPQTWDTVGGPGSVMALEPGLLIFSQSSEVHELTEQLLAALRKSRDRQVKTPGGPPVLLCDEAPTHAIREALAKHVSLEFTEEPLKEAIRAIGKKSNVQIVLDEKALTEAGIATDIPVTKTIHDLSLHNALQLLLRPLQLTYIISDEVLMITSNTEAENRLVIRAYPVKDLIHHRFDDLINTLTATIAPQTWDSVGGPGAVDAFEPSMALVISQTDEVHQMIDRLLGQIRRVSAQIDGNANKQTKAEDTGEPILRVYTLLEPSDQALVFQQQSAPANATERNRGTGIPDRASQRREADAAALTQSAQAALSVVQPAGVPPEEAADLIRSLIQPHTWNEPRVFMRATKSRLLVQNSLAAHREIAKLLERLGPWQEENDGRQLMTPRLGGLGGGFAPSGGFGF